MRSTKTNIADDHLALVHVEDVAGRKRGGYGGDGGEGRGKKEGFRVQGEKSDISRSATDN